MTEITVCKVVNKANEKEELTVAAKWSNLKLKLTIFKTDNTVLAGETLLENFSQYAKTFDKPLDVYLKEMKDTLSVRNNEVTFHLEEGKFFWKRNSRYRLALINVNIVQEMEYLVDFTSILLENFLETQSKTSQLQYENTCLRNINVAMTDDLKKMVLLKNEIESSLYQRFALVLNSKKEKIRDLNSKIESLENKHKSIFDEETGPCEFESESKNEDGHILIQASLKVNEAIPSNSMKEDTSAIGIEEQITHKLDSDSAPSISIDNLTSTIGDDEETPDFFSNETECEIELKLEDEKADDYLKSSANEEISSEEMF